MRVSATLRSDAAQVALNAAAAIIIARGKSGAQKRAAPAGVMNMQSHCRQNRGAKRCERKRYAKRDTATALF